jgi:hypothetical protein
MSLLKEFLRAGIRIARVFGQLNYSGYINSANIGQSQSDEGNTVVVKVALKLLFPWG